MGMNRKTHRTITANVTVEFFNKLLNFAAQKNVSMNKFLIQSLEELYNIEEKKITKITPERLAQSANEIQK
jgi:hypothetical protein